MLVQSNECHTAQNGTNRWYAQTNTRTTPILGETVQFREKYKRNLKEQWGLSNLVLKKRKGKHN